MPIIPPLWVCSPEVRPRRPRRAHLDDPQASAPTLRSGERASETAHTHRASVDESNLRSGRLWSIVGGECERCDDAWVPVDDWGGVELEPREAGQFGEAA
jgi:hypothetical protein